MHNIVLKIVIRLRLFVGDNDTYSYCALKSSSEKKLRVYVGIKLLTVKCTLQTFQSNSRNI